ncbi:MAG: uracil-DNA glycosylase [Planctomycetota bacterium]|jgi:uracil-DNA glycosylase
MDSPAALIDASDVHPDWHNILYESLNEMDLDYLESLHTDANWLPGTANLLASFRRSLSGVRFLLIGESPYPRPQSANGIAFYDAAVSELFSEQGLSKAVNRATSMRNLIKTMLIAEGFIDKDEDGKIPQSTIAQLNKHDLIQTMPALFDKLERRGFLILNATPVLHAKRKPALDANYWLPFLQRFLALLAEQSSARVTLLLWGKIAAEIEKITPESAYHRIVCEHPYNVSFIDNPQMLDLFAELKLMQATA